jgi:hypothetical protein
MQRERGNSKVLEILIVEVEVEVIVIIVIVVVQPSALPAEV